MWQNKTLIFSIIAIFLIAGSIFGIWKILSKPKEVEKLPNLEEDYLTNSLEEMLGENFDVISFPAADNQFPIPEYEKMYPLAIDEFDGSKEVEFFLMYGVAGDYQSDIKNFYLENEELENQRWIIAGDSQGLVYDFNGKEVESNFIDFVKEQDETYSISIAIVAVSKPDILDFLGISALDIEEKILTIVTIKENWPIGFEYSKELIPNSPFCQYFDKDFKKVLNSIVEEVKLNGLHEIERGINQPPLRLFYYVAKQPLSSFDDVYEVKNAFLASGYQVDWEGEGKPFHLSKKIAENIFILLLLVSIIDI